MKICILGENIKVSSTQKSALELIGDLSVISKDVTYDEMVELCRDFEAIITYCRVNAETLEKIKKLRFLCLLSTGYDECLDPSVTREFCKTKDLFICNTPNAATTAVSEYILSAILSGTRKLVGFKGRPTEWKSQEFKDLEIGIIGMGQIGCSLANLISSLRIKGSYYSRDPLKNRNIPSNINIKSLDDLCIESNVIAITCELNSSSRDMINKFYLNKMKSDVVLVNAARAEVFNLHDLYYFLSKNINATAIIDDKKRIESLYPAILDLQNCEATPHIAFLTDSSLNSYMDIAILNLKNYCSGVNQSQVNFER